jgi:hypothetical protein
MNPAPPSAAALLELVHRFYPANLHGDDPRYAKSEEHQRLLQVRSTAWENREAWKGVLAQLRTVLPQSEVEDWTALHSDSCWRVRVYLPASIPVEGGGQEFQSVVGLVSLLAPVSAIYTSFHQKFGTLWRQPTLFYEPVPQARGIEEAVERVLHAALGVQRLSTQTLFTAVPDIQCFNVPLGKAHLIDCLFTDDRW